MDNHPPTRPLIPKHSQLLRPLFEFSGACAGCGETPYIKLVTQLYGDRMIIANATGCSSIYGGNLPTTPYCKDNNGRGPAWANSLFEDNAEFGYGMRFAEDKNKSIALDLLNASHSKQLIDDDLYNKIINNPQLSDVEINTIRQDVDNLKQKLKDCGENIAQQLLEYADHLINKSVWIFGGDGWAYDIGYGGLDHIINSDKNVNVLILDTEVYSNTGGQQSKSTPLGASAKFASAGKILKKKDLGLIAMMSKNAYVAQIALDANPVQAIKAIREAEAYNGPSIVICYCQCISHGFDLVDGGVHQMNAVNSGLWPLYRFNPNLNDNNLSIDSHFDESKNITYLTEYLKSENRFKSVHKNDMEEFIKKVNTDIVEKNRYLSHIAKYFTKTE